MCLVSGLQRKYKTDEALAFLGPYSLIYSLVDTKNAWHRSIAIFSYPPGCRVQGLTLKNEVPAQGT